MPGHEGAVATVQKLRLEKEGANIPTPPPLYHTHTHTHVYTYIHTIHTYIKKKQLIRPQFKSILHTVLTANQMLLINSKYRGFKFLKICLLNLNTFINKKTFQIMDLFHYMDC